MTESQGIAGEVTTEFVRENCLVDHGLFRANCP